MPNTEVTVPEINSIAVIGGGPSGIAAIYEFSRTLKNGHSLYGEKDVSKWDKSGETAFKKIVLFERNATLGGVWSKSAWGNNKTEPALPDLERVTDPSDPDQIFERAPIDSELQKKIDASDKDHPVIIKKEAKGLEDKYQWRSSGAYEGLFTNIPTKFLAYSYQKPKEPKNKLSDVPDYQTAESLGEYLTSVVEDNDLARYARTNSNVERVSKLKSGKWEVVVRESTEDTAHHITDKWYREEFDAVVLGNGATVPRVPNLKGFKDYTKENKDKVKVVIAKSIKDPSFLKDSKKILIVGSSVSAVDLIQYAFPRDLEKNPIVVSRRRDRADLDWVTFASHAEGLINKPEIAEFLPGNKIKFTDGSVEEGFDTIVFATGYHAYFPFLGKEAIEKDPDLTKFYLYTFSISDPTLVSLSIVYAVFVWERVEAQVNAISGVWSHHHKLPSKEVQKKWYDAKFSYKLAPSVIKRDFIEPLSKLGLEDRPDVFQGKTDRDPLFDLHTGYNDLLTLFFKIKENKTTVADIALSS